MKNEELLMMNEELLMKNEELLMKNEELLMKRKGYTPHCEAGVYQEWFLNHLSLQFQVTP